MCIAVIPLPQISIFLLESVISSAGCFCEFVGETKIQRCDERGEMAASYKTSGDTLESLLGKMRIEGKGCLNAQSAHELKTYAVNKAEFPP